MQAVVYRPREGPSYDGGVPTAPEISGVYIRVNTAFRHSQVPSFPTTAHAQAFPANGGMLTSSPEPSKYDIFILQRRTECFFEFVMRSSTVVKN